MKMLIFALTFLFGLSALAQNVTPSPMLEFKGQKKSVTPWGKLSLDSFLSFEKWKYESDIRDQIPDWEKIIRERNHREMVGRIYQCVGACRIDRGESFFNGSHRTGLYEGDEVQTIGDSYAWIFLFDGTMVRLSPQSSVTFNEFNIGIKENFINARINAGNVLWLSRHQNTFEEKNVRETDVIFFPSPEYEALPISEQEIYDDNDLIDLLSDQKTHSRHYQSLNEKILNNNNWIKNKPTYAFLVMPNATVMGESPSVEAVVLLGSRTYLKKRSIEKLGLIKKEEHFNDLSLQLRGFENKNLTVIQEDLWIMIDEKGRTLAEAEDVAWLNVGEFITKRIPSLMHGREIFLERYSEFAFREKYDPLILAKNDGYRLWGKIKSDEGEDKSDLQLRLDFLKEYFRRVETSNLLTSSRFKERLISRGEKVDAMEYGSHFFKTALNLYYKFGENPPDNSNDKETGEVLNSTTKLLWKKMYGIR